MATPRTASANPTAPADQRTFQSSPGIIETVTPVRLTAVMIERAFADLERLGGGPVWCVDTTPTTSFEPGAIPVAAKGLPRLKKNGLRRIVVVATSAAIRMAARTVSVASGMDMQVVENRVEAARHVAT